MKSPSSFLPFIFFGESWPHPLSIPWIFLSTAFFLLQHLYRPSLIWLLFSLQSFLSLLYHIKGITLDNVNICSTFFLCSVLRVYASAPSLLTTTGSPSTSNSRIFPQDLQMLIRQCFGQHKTGVPAGKHLFVSGHELPVLHRTSVLNSPCFWLPCLHQVHQ